jgi:hypothetical protein
MPPIAGGLKRYGPYGGAVLAAAAVAQFAQQYVLSPAVSCVEGSTIGLRQ